MMATPCSSLAMQLLMCCTLMLVFARPVAPASRGLMPPAATLATMPPAATAPTAPAPSIAPAPAPTAVPVPSIVPAPAPTAVPAPSIAPAQETKIRDYTWNVEYILWAPDCKQRGMIGINGIFPGPTITAKAGERIRVIVNNKLHTEGVAIHWHGMQQIGTPWADGTASISQCPINPGETFTYEFTADKPGTYFYHGHYGMQRAAGLYGSLIVDVPDGKAEPFTYDGELSMLLSDWYHEALYAQAAGLERKDKHFQWIGEPQTLLINGKGQFDCTLGNVTDFQRGIRPDAKTCKREDGDSVEAACNKDKNTASCEAIRRSECGPFCRETQCGPVVFEVEPGKTYRLRIASTTSLSALNVKVQNHTLTVVEADGNYVKNFTVDDIDIYSGESYSVLLKADQKPSSYWISVGVRGRTPKTLPALAILKYTNSSEAWPEDPPPETPKWDDVQRSKNFTKKIKNTINYQTNTDNKVLPEPAADQQPIIMLNTQELIGGQIKWAINRVSLALPATPYLGAYHHGIERVVFESDRLPDFNTSYDVTKPPEEQDSGPATVSKLVHSLDDDVVVDVVLQNADMRRDNVSEAHPWHLHGHDFWVLGYGEGLYNHTEHAKKLNTKDPPLRNTVVVFPHGWTAIRFKADNPGVWAFHCHIEPHLHMGMGVVFVEGKDKLRGLNVPKEAMMCGETAAAMVGRQIAPAPSPTP